MPEFLITVQAKHAGLLEEGVSRSFSGPLMLTSRIEEFLYLTYSGNPTDRIDPASTHLTRNYWGCGGGETWGLGGVLGGQVKGP